MELNKSICSHKFPKDLYEIHATTQKMKFSIKDFFSKCDPIRRKLRIGSHLLEKSLMENFSFCVVCSVLKVFYLHIIFRHYYYVCYKHGSYKAKCVYLDQRKSLLQLAISKK